MNRPRTKNRHLPKWMHFKHGRHWLVRGGKWRPLARDFGEALREYAEIVAQPRGGMADLIERVMLELAGRKRPLATSTMQQYRIAASKLKRAFLEFAPEQVKARHVAKFKLQQQGKPNIANRMLSLLRTVFAHAVEWQLVDSNPCIGIKRLEEATRDRYVADDEFEKLKAAARPRLGAILDLLYYTAQRIGDVLALTPEDLLDEGIRFRQSKTGAKLIVEWSPALRDAVRRVREACGGENVRARTIIHIRGRRCSYKGVRDDFERTRRRAGIEHCTLHDLRAKSLTDADLQGIDAQVLGGHTTRARTEKYIRVRRVPRVKSPTFGQSIDAGEKSA